MSSGEIAVIVTVGISGMCILAILKIVADALQSHVELQRLAADCEKLRAAYAGRIREARERHQKNRQALTEKMQEPIKSSADASIDTEEKSEPELAQAA